MHSFLAIRTCQLVSSPFLFSLFLSGGKGLIPLAGIRLVEKKSGWLVSKKTPTIELFWQLIVTKPTRYGARRPHSR